MEYSIEWKHPGKINFVRSGKSRAGLDSVRSRKLSQRKRWQSVFGAICPDILTTVWPKFKILEGHYFQKIMYLYRLSKTSFYVDVMCLVNRRSIFWNGDLQAAFPTEFVLPAFAISTTECRQIHK